MRKALIGTAFLTGILLSGCFLTDAVEEAFNVFKVKFNDAGWSDPSVKSPSAADMLYAVNLGKGLSLSDFSVHVAYQVQGDNSGNSGTAAFGSRYAKPVLHFYLGDTAKATGVAFNETIEPFEIKGGGIDTIEFATDIPFSWFKENAPDIARKIVNGQDLPYRLTASLEFTVPTPAGDLRSGTSELDIGKGGIATRPDAVKTYGSKILDLF